MIRLLENLPDAVEVDGIAYPIHTDFRDWIAFEQLIYAEDVAEDEKLILMLSWYKSGEPEDFEQAIHSLLWFFQGGRVLEAGSVGGSTSRTVIYDYDEDAEQIYSSFLHAYGLDLADADLHWWKFRALLLYIPENTKLATAMGYRAADAKDLNERQRRLKRLHDLGTRGRPQTMAERDRGLMDRARQARQRAELDCLPRL